MFHHYPIDFDPHFCLFFFYNLTPPTEIYTLSLHDALPISELPGPPCRWAAQVHEIGFRFDLGEPRGHVVVVVLRQRDRKSTRLNSSHVSTSYAVCCSKKKTETRSNTGNRTLGSMIRSAVTI